MKNSEYILESSRLVLKNLDESGAQALLDFNLKNKEFLKEWISRSAKDYYTIEKHKRVLSNKRALFDRDKEYRFYLFEKHNPDIVIGDIGFSQVIRGAFQSCYLGYMIDEDHRGKGYIPEAIQRGVQFMFDERNLHRIEANIIPRNQASIRVVEKLGFVNEGLAKNYVRINGKWEDHVHYVKFNNNWKAPD